jgi:hypothetical protein
LDLDYPVTIVDYDPRWPALFRAEWERLRGRVAPPKAPFIGRVLDVPRRRGPVGTGEG